MNACVRAHAHRCVCAASPLDMSASAHVSAMHACKYAIYTGRVQEVTSDPQLRKELAARRRKKERRRPRCRRANPLLSGIYHPAAAPVYALLDRACISRKTDEGEMEEGGR